MEAVAVTGDSDKIKRHFSGELTGEVGKKKYRAFEDADEVEWLIGKILADFSGQFLDALF